MSEDDTGKNRVPYRPHRIIVASVSSLPLESLHQLLIGQVTKNQLKAFEIPDLFEFVPTKNLKLWYNGDGASPL